VSGSDTEVPKDQFIEELNGDGFNDERFEYAGTRYVSQNPSPANYTPETAAADVTFVAISKPEQASSFEANVPVVETTAFLKRLGAILYASNGVLARTSDAPAIRCECACSGRQQRYRCHRCFFARPARSCRSRSAVCGYRSIRC
jgi:hypothetical protein